MTSLCKEGSIQMDQEAVRRSGQLKWSDQEAWFKPVISQCCLSAVKHIFVPVFQDTTLLILIHMAVNERK